jgi:hypothetical protein
MIPIFLPPSKHKFCHLCGSQLLFEYTTYSTGLVVCSQCERTAPRCTHCKQPARTLQAVDQHRLCSFCLSRLPRCSACNKPIVGTYFRIGDSPKPYCVTCSQQRPACHTCGAPLGPDGQQLLGGQYRCGECAKTMVLDDQVAESLYRQVIQHTRAIFERDVQRIPVLRVVEPQELAAVQQQHGRLTPPSLGAGMQHVLGFFEQLGQRRTIYVERALPRATLIGTLAHEYGHAWQADYVPHKQGMLVREGFAEWLSWSVLVTLGHTREAARATRREDEYGQGLRHFIALEKNAGRQAVFKEAAGQR